jgi:hypothetical protein
MKMRARICNMDFAVPGDGHWNYLWLQVSGLIGKSALRQRRAG